METTGFLHHLLNGMDPGFFLAMYIFAFIGMLVWFGTDVIQGVKKDPETPNTFSWKVMLLKGGIRLFINLVIMFFGVTYFPEMIKFILSLGITDLPKDFVPVINGFSAFLIVGIGADTISKKIATFGKDGFKQVASLINKG